MKITHEDISKFMVGGQKAEKFAPHIIVYSEMEVRANIYTAMKYIIDNKPFKKGGQTQRCTVCESHNMPCLGDHVGRLLT